MYQRILVPIDGSEIAEQGLREALRLAGLTGARLRLVHVVDLQNIATQPGAYATPTVEFVGLLDKSEHDKLAHAAALAAAAGVPAETALLENLSEPLCDLIVGEARRWSADLIVIGTHGRRGLDRWLLGSDAEAVSRMAPVPVLLVRGASPTTAAHHESRPQAA